MRNSKLKTQDSDRWLFVLFLGILAWAPLPFGSNQPWLWHLLGVAVFGLGLAWIGLSFLGKTTKTLNVKAIKLPLILLALWLALLLGQLLFSTTASFFITVDFVIRSFALVSLFILTLLLCQSTKRLKVLAWVIVISGFSQAFYGSMMTLSGLEYGFFLEKEHYRGLATGTFINRNHFAGFLEMALAVGIGLLLSQLSESDNENSFKQNVKFFLRWLMSIKMLLRVFLAIMVIGLVLSHSRMGNAAFFISLLVTSALWLRLEQKKSKQGVVFVLVTLLIIDIAIVGAWFGVGKVVDRLEQTSTLNEGRDEVVRDSITYLKDHMWFGSGAGTFEVVFPQYRGSDIAANYDYLHNDYLQFAVETGLTGVLLLGLFVLLSMYQALKVMRYGERSLYRGMSFASFMATFSIMIHSTVDFNLQIPANSFLFMVLLAMPWLPSIKLKKENTPYS